MSNNNWTSSSDDARARKSPWDVTGSRDTSVDPSSILANEEDVASIISSLNGANTNLFGKANSVFAGANITYAFPTQGFKNGSDSSAPPQVQASLANPAAIINAAGNVNGSIGGGNSDSGSDIMNSKLKDSLSAISAPVGQPHSTNGSQSRFASNLFASASVSGVNVSSGFPTKLGGGSFLEKFGSVTEKTRELELNMNKLTLGNNGQSPNLNNTSGARRSSILPNESAISTSPQATFREPTRQSFSEKFDNYINSGVDGRHMSFSSDIHSEHNSIGMDRNGNDSSSSHTLGNHNIWNPATATTFTPSDAQQQRTPNEYGFYNAAPVYNQPGFMPQQVMAPPFANNFLQFPPQMQMQMQMQFFNGGGAGIQPAVAANKDKSAENSGVNGESSGVSENQLNDEKSDSQFATGSARGSTEPSSSSPAPQAAFNNQSMFPNRQMSPFMIPPFSPPMYGLFNGPPGAIPPQFDGSNGNNTPDGVIGGPDMVGNVSTPQPFDLNTTGKGMHNNRDSNYLGNNGTNNQGGMRKSPAPRNNPKRKIYRSPLLEDFRSNKSKEYFLKDIYGHGIEFSKDQHGSRFIQQQLEKASAADKEVIFNEIREAAPELMTDVFGNYVVQKFFEFGSTTQKSILLESMKGKINQLSLQMYGCRVVQKALEAVTLEEQLSVLDELRDNVLVLVKDQNGNHVIQKSIECVPIEHSAFILDALRHQIYHLSTHTYGCRVIQRLLEYSHEEDQRFILDELNGFMYYLIQDQYGNYVIQHIIEHGEQRDRSLIIDVVLQHIVELSKHKFASNAVEKCIIFGDADHREKIYQAMLKDNMDRKADVNENSPLALMMKDQYANYVVQKMVDISNGDEKTLLVVKIRKCLEQINKNNFGKHLASIEKLIALSESIAVKE